MDGWKCLQQTHAVNNSGHVKHVSDYDFYQIMVMALSEATLKVLAPPTHVCHIFKKTCFPDLCQFRYNYNIHVIILNKLLYIALLKSHSVFSESASCLSRT